MFSGVQKGNFGSRGAKRVTIYQELAKLKRLEVQYLCNFVSDALWISTFTTVNDTLLLTL